MSEVCVVKIGGNVIDNPQALNKFLADFVLLPSPKILIHGGGKIATSVAASLGVESEFINGRRVTSPEMRDVAVMVYAGLINKKIVATLGTLGCKAIGLTGADADCLIAEKRSPVPVDYGEVGDVRHVDADMLKSFLDLGLTPVLCAISVDKSGYLLNTNADTIATETAIAMASVMPSRMLYCFELDGVMRDINDSSSVIPNISEADFREMKESGVVAKGMIPKISNALKAAATPGITAVIIKNSDKVAVDGSGTVIRP